MTALSAEQRGDLVQALLPEAAGLVTAVREESQEEITARLRGMSRYELEVVAVILASMVDPERSLGDLFAWIAFDENGDPLSRPAPSKRSLRDLQPAAAPRGLGVDEVAVERALAGDRVPLNQVERALAVDRGIRRGMDYDLVAERLGMEREAVRRAWERVKQKARAEGRPVPTQPVGEIATAT
ncbi:hypothetical protein [Streptomyces tubercidicus]|uniref:hypothetical protein n=1 Tax=Streptomyces tubercidicus TaxID=47759 RepID=UPI0034661CEC